MYHSLLAGATSYVMIDLQVGAGHLAGWRKA
jgi:hypothetical protein